MILPELVDMSCLLLPTAAAGAAAASPAALTAAHLTAAAAAADGGQLTQQLFNVTLLPAAAACPQLFYGAYRDVYTYFYLFTGTVVRICLR